jgi:hypothetical protein
MFKTKLLLVIDALTQTLAKLEHWISINFAMKHMYRAFCRVWLSLVVLWLSLTLILFVR